MSTEEFYARVAAYTSVGVRRDRALILARRDGQCGLRWRPGLAE